MAQDRGQANRLGDLVGQVSCKCLRSGNAAVGERLEGRETVSTERGLGTELAGRRAVIFMAVGPAR